MAAAPTDGASGLTEDDGQYFDLASDRGPDSDDGDSEEDLGAEWDPDPEPAAARPPPPAGLRPFAPPGHA